MSNQHSLDIIKYTSKPEEVFELRSLVRQWHAEEAFWDFDHILSSLSRPFVSMYYLKQNDSANWLGAIIFQAVMDQADLIYIYIKPDFRHKGYGGLLLAKMFECLRLLPDCKKVFLEVKDSNSAAHSIYLKYGFAETRRIKDYYATGQDAIVLAADIHA